MTVPRWIPLKMRTISEKVVEKIKKKKTLFIVNQFSSSRKSCSLWDNAEKHCTIRQASDDSVIRRMRLACWVNKATETDRHRHTHTHTQNMQNLMLFHDNNGYANTPQCYVCKYNACLVCFMLCRRLSTGHITWQDSYRIICNGLTHSLSIPNRNTMLKINKYLTV